MSRLADATVSVGRLLVDALESLSSKPFRTLAMVAGIILGVGSATAAVLIADTQQNQINRQFDLQRSAYVVIQAQNPDPAGLNPAGLTALARLEPVSGAGEFTIWQESAAVARSPYVSANAGTTPVIVASAAGIAASGTTRTAGADPALIEVLGRAGVVWIGRSLAQQLGITADAPVSIVVGGRPYSVGGILTNQHGFGYVDNSVVMSRTLAMRGQSGPTSVRAVAHVRPGSAAAVGRYALAALDPTQTQSLVDATPPDGAILLANVAGDLRAVGIALGTFVGFVGMVAVANTLMMSVHQRSRELGLRSAIGWSRPRIAALILSESAIAGLVAALVGAALGMLAAVVWCHGQGWQLVVARELAPTVIVAGALASVVGGLVPAVHAASVSPMTAMRT